LGRSDRSFLNQFTTFGDKFSKWYSKIINILIETCIREDTNAHRKGIKSKKPCITWSLIKSIEKRHALNRKRILSNSNLAGCILKIYDIALKKLLRKVKRNYFTK